MDFVVMPVYCQYTTTSITPEQIFSLVSTLSGSPAQVEALHIMKDFHPWQPLTLQQSGLIHISFGGILGLAAYMRGKENIAAIDQETKMGLKR